MQFFTKEEFGIKYPEYSNADISTWQIEAVSEMIFSQIGLRYRDASWDTISVPLPIKNASMEQMRFLLEHDIPFVDFDKDIKPIVSNVILNKEAAALTNTSFITVTKQLNQNISQLFESDIELDIILYLGLCNGAGWATTLDGRDAVLLGIEKIIELNWQNEDDMQALIFHEIGHIWHKTHGILYPHTHSNGERSLVQLYQEGIGMRADFMSRR